MRDNGQIVVTRAPDSQSAFPSHGSARSRGETGFHISGRRRGERQLPGRLRVFLVCPGVGHVNRGYETFTRECFEALKADDRFALFLFKGAGPGSGRDRSAWCLRRERLLTRYLGGVIGRDGYYVENATFVLGLIPHLLRHKPAVIYFSDSPLGNLLWHWRRFTGAKFKLLASNGGPIGPPDFPRYDHVHQVSQVYYDESAAAGRGPDTQTLIPYGFNISRDFRPLSADERTALRCRLGLPTDRTVVLTVGAINSTQKRMDYVIKEVAAFPGRRPFLVMLGQRQDASSGRPARSVRLWSPPTYAGYQKDESRGVLELADRLLGPTGYRCHTVGADEVTDYYDAADAFVLASHKEGFGRAMAEALARGLPCLAHDCGNSRFVLGRYGYFADLSRDGALAQLLSDVLAAGPDPHRAAAQHADAYERLSWDRLAPQYVDMIVRCAGIPHPVTVR